MVVLLAFSSNFAFTQVVRPQSVADGLSNAESTIERTWKMLREVRAKSFPELSEKDIKIETFRSNSDFFKARFSFKRYLTFRHLKTTVYVNPAVFSLGASDEAIRAILAHELAHALYYGSRNRLALLGLVRLINGSFTAKFERKADLSAVSRGYGEGLIIYRKWLYMNIPAKYLQKKKRNYFTPSEITVLIAAFRKDPAVFDKLSRNIPRNLKELVEMTETARPK